MVNVKNKTMQCRDLFAVAMTLVRVPKIGEADESWIKPVERHVPDLVLV